MDMKMRVGLAREPEPVVDPVVAPVVAPKKRVLLECAVCHNTDTVEGVLARQHYPGSCGHCGGAFRVIEK